MKREFFYQSKDGETQIHAIEWKPESEPKAILQLCHGMVEHIERYDEFAAFMAENGYYVVGNDHLGHGQSVTSPEKKGFFHEEQGNSYVIADIHQLRIKTEKQYPHLPYFMAGHSMGSFLLRQYLGLYGKGLSGAILIGTGNQPNAVLTAGKLVCKLISMVKGWNYRSVLVYQMANGSYDKAYENVTDGSGWICSDPAVVKKYKEDPNCGFRFTVNAYYHMFSGMKKMNKQEMAGDVPTNIPILFAAGKEDLVGGCGKGVEQIYQRYVKNGMKDVELKLYENARHEILNEYEKKTVFADFLAWLEKRN